MPDLGLAELRERWVELYGRPAPKYFRRGLLVRALAYQIQVKAFGGLSEATKQRLREIAEAVRNGTFDTADLEPRIKPGTKLIRTWKKETHEVMVLEDGFAWKRARYSSLSTIAKTITGTSWNGWKFFGLKGPVRKDGFDAPRPFQTAKTATREGCLAPHPASTTTQAGPRGRRCVSPPSPRNCAAPSTPGNPPRRVWSRISIRCMPSGRPARPI